MLSWLLGCSWVLCRGFWHVGWPQKGPRLRENADSEVRGGLELFERSVSLEESWSGRD
jgi:hypothetical protein